MKTGSPKWLYRFFAVITIYHGLFAMLLLLDFLTHPFVPDALFGSMELRVVIVTLVVPIALAISILIVRRTTWNVNGLFLLLLLTLIINGTARHPLLASLAIRHPCAVYQYCHRFGLYSSCQRECVGTVIGHVWRRYCRRRNAYHISARTHPFLLDFWWRIRMDWLYLFCTIIPHRHVLSTALAHFPDWVIGLYLHIHGDLVIGYSSICLGSKHESLFLQKRMVSTSSWFFCRAAFPTACVINLATFHHLLTPIVDFALSWFVTCHTPTNEMVVVGRTDRNGLTSHF